MIGEWCFVYIYKERVLTQLKVYLPAHPNLDPAVLFTGRGNCLALLRVGELYRGNRC